MKKDNDGAFIGCGILLITTPLSALWSGYVLSVLWTWFVVTAFEARPLSIPAAIGLSIVVRFLTFQPTPEDKSKELLARVIDSVGLAFFWPAFALLFGWVVTFFM